MMTTTMTIATMTTQRAAHSPTTPIDRLPIPLRFCNHPFPTATHICATAIPRLTTAIDRPPRSPMEFCGRCLVCNGLLGTISCPVPKSVSFHPPYLPGGTSRRVTNTNPPAPFDRRLCCCSRCRHRSGPLRPRSNHHPRCVPFPKRHDILFGAVSFRAFYNPCRCHQSRDRPRPPSQADDHHHHHRRRSGDNNDSIDPRIPCIQW
mmetsp:Transcript_13025/g.27386  ORF Transcript_13025/g.27386 Transcript_13025/m.27386 type:complete len:205 (-) Transcript_13025:440-1054(-)